MTLQAVAVGPFAFAYLPDGDDPGTGLVMLETLSGYECRTPLGVPRSEWDEFLETVAKTPVELPDRRSDQVSRPGDPPAARAAP